MRIFLFTLEVNEKWNVFQLFSEYDSCIRRLCRSLEATTLATDRLELLDIEMSVKTDRARAEHESVLVGKDMIRS